MRNASGLSLLSCGLLAFVLLAASALAGPSKAVKDWYSYCSDSLVCNFSTEPKGEGVYSVEFQRSSKANAPVLFKISTKGIVKEGSELAISIPGYMDEMIFQFSQGKFDNGQWRFSSPAIGSALLPAMKAGATMQIHVQTSDGNFSPEISLSGLSAVMLFVDEVQDRIDHVDALIAKGSKPATDRKNNVVELSSSKELPPAVMHRWSMAGDQCNDFDGDLIEQFGGIRLSIDPDKDIQIYVIPCGGPGAYNLSYGIYVFDKQSAQARTLSMPTMSAKGPTIMDTIINMSWDETTSRLSAFYKGRGLGDCGVASDWQWDGNGAYGNFILVEERAKDNCDGNYDEWPLVWPQVQ